MMDSMFLIAWLFVLGMFTYFPDEQFYLILGDLNYFMEIFMEVQKEASACLY